MNYFDTISNQMLAIEPTWAQHYLARTLTTANISGHNTLFDPEQPEFKKPHIKSLSSSNLDGSAHSLCRVVNGVAVIQIVGPLGHRFSWFSWGYRELASKLMAAARDPKVNAILLDMETPGGTVAGLNDFANLVGKIDRESKPVFSLINDMAASAGLAISSQTRRRFITESGQTGSLGTVMVHVDHSQMLENAGLGVTLIHAGAHKVDGNPYHPLPDEVFQKCQAECQRHRQDFAELVSKGTGISVDALLATEAQMYQGKDAIDVGLADEQINAYDIVDTISHQSSTNSLQKGVVMTQSTIDTNVDPVDQLPETPAPNAEDERKRIAAIMQSDGGKSNTALAEHLAYHTDIAADAAIKALDVASQNSTSQSGTNSGFEEAMSQDNPEVDSDADTLETEASTVDDYINLYRGSRK